MKRVIFLFGAVALMAPLLLAKDLSVRLKVFPQQYDVILEGTVVKPATVKGEWRTYHLRDQAMCYLLQAPGYRPYYLNLDPAKNQQIELKMDRTDSLIDLVGEFPTGSQPKSVAFTPDGRHALVAQLSGKGVDLYETMPFRWLRQIDIPPPKGEKNQSGYVEFAMLPWQNEIWVSQMTTGRVHVLEMDDFSYKQSFSVNGAWSKVICVHPDRQLAFVSNWLSEDISVIDAVNHKLLRKVKVTGTPRGMAVSPDRQFLYVTIYATANIDKIRLSDFKRVKTLTWPGIGAKRHVLINPAGTEMYVSDMENGDIWVIDVATEKLIKRIPIAPKLNTFDMTPDGRLLFISSRGENNPATYLEKGPDFGTMSVVDTRTLSKIDWVWGRNQPTGLAVHPGGRLVACTDFLDNNLEVWDISRLLASLEQQSAGPLTASLSATAPSP
jgi:YVTN family beta-propeller protein